MAGTAQPSGLLPVGGPTLLYTGKNIIDSVLMQPGATVTIYDNATGAASGPIVFQGVNAGTNSLDHFFNFGVRCDLGLTYVISGTTTGAIIYFGAA